MRKKTKQKIRKPAATLSPEARLTTLIEFCKANGVTRVEMDGIKLEIAPPKNDFDNKDPIQTPDTLTDEEVLFWSSDRTY